MAQFATPDELAVRLGIELTDAEELRADALLTLASGLIQREVGQTIELVTDDELTVRGSWPDRVRLPQRPIISVTSVSLDGTPLEAEEWYLVSDELVRLRGWGGSAVVATVTYSHGYEEPPPEVKTVCLEAVARVWVNPGGAAQEGYGGEAVTFPARYTSSGSEVGGLLILRAEAAVLRRRLGRSTGSLVLR